MKRILSLFLVALMLALTLASCAAPHYCIYEDSKWSHDEDSHWQECERCKAARRHAEHQWNEGEVLAEPTPMTVGETLYTCTKCSATKTERVPYPGMTSEEWDAILAYDLYTNFTYNERSVLSLEGMDVTMDATYYITRGKVLIEVTMLGETETQVYTDQATIEMIVEQLVDSFRATLPYESFLYDLDTNTYVATEPIFVESLGSETDYMTVSFAKRRVESIRYGGTVTVQGTEVTYESVVTLSDIGYTVIE